jgi:hypothetical protein
MPFIPAAASCGVLRVKIKKYEISDLPSLDFLKMKDVCLNKLETDFLSNLYDKNVIKVKTNGKVLREALDRSISRKRPCSKNGEEIRDAIIWLNLLKYCKKISHDFAFVSDDANAFAGEDKKNLHNDLIDDVRLHKINVQYFSVLEDFLREHAEPIANITFEWVSGRIDMTKAKSIIMGFLLYNEFVAHYFTPCNYLDQNYFVPEGKPEFPLGSGPRIEFEDFFVWRFEDKHMELSLIFYAYIEAEFNCMPRDYSTAYHQFPSYHDPYSRGYAASHAPHSKSYSSGHGSPHGLYSDFGSGDLGLGIHGLSIAGSYHTSTMERRICFADLRFRISAKIDGDKILLENIEYLYKI